jgi:predicted porin
MNKKQCFTFSRWTAALLGIGAMAVQGVHAQGAAPAPGVTLYGIIDAGVEVVNKVNGVGTIQRLPSNTGMIPSRVGMRGAEDLGGGLRGVFTLEMGFAPDTGASGQGGRLFGRQSFVGLAGPWGSVTLGRQYSMLFWSVLDSDLIGPAIYAMGSLDAYIPNARTDNAVAYRGTFGPLSLGAGYSFGRDTVNAGPSPVGTNCPGESGADKQACRDWSAMVKYDLPAWGVALGYDSQRGRTPASATDLVFNNLTSSNKKDNRLSVGGYFKLGDAKIAGGLLRRDNDGDAVKPKSNLWYVGASYPVTPALTVEGQWLNLRYKNVDDRDSTMYVARAVYSLSKRTAVYSQIGHIRNDRLAAVSVSGGAAGSNPAAGSSQSGVNFGIRHTF